MDGLEVSVTGDAEGGWIVEMHDGDRYECYPVHAETAEAAEAAARAKWDGRS